MAQSNVLKRFLDAGMSFTEMTQSKAEALVKELVKAGEVQTEQAQALVTDLVERSRRSTEALIEQVRSEITSSADAWGLATIADLDRLDRSADRNVGVEVVLALARVGCGRFHILPDLSRHEARR
ncbi:MAG TPA: hypothetical protein PKE56_14650, partial [Acidimicrobiales bacterium]|nr:hypothetical protein [Acidimicrobiales bacterium]